MDILDNTPRNSKLMHTIVDGKSGVKILKMVIDNIIFNDSSDNDNNCCDQY